MFSSYYLSGTSMKHLRYISLFRNNIESISTLKGYISLEVIIFRYIFWIIFYFIYLHLEFKSETQSNFNIKHGYF